MLLWFNSHLRSVTHFTSVLLLLPVIAFTLNTYNQTLTAKRRWESDRFPFKWIDVAFGLGSRALSNILIKMCCQKVQYVWAEEYIFILLFLCMTVLLSYGGNYIGRLQAAVTLTNSAFLLWFSLESGQSVRKISCGFVWIRSTVRKTVIMIINVILDV